MSNIQDTLNMDMEELRVASEQEISLSNDVYEAIERFNKFTLADSTLPSIHYPIRTADFWRKIMTGIELTTSFFTYNEKGYDEIHQNSTELWKKVVNETALHEVLRETEEELSLKGESDVTSIYQEKKVVPLKIALVRKAYFPDQSLRMYQGIINLDTGTNPWILTMKYEFDSNGDLVAYNVPMIKENVMQGTIWKTISVDLFNKTYKQSIKEKVVYKGLKFIPVVTFTNEGADRNGSGTSDTAKVQDILQRLDIIANGKDAMIRTSKRRIIKQKVNGTMDLGAPVSDKLARQLDENTDIIELDWDPTVDGGNPIISDGTLNIQQWNMEESALENKYYTHTGENVSTDSHGNNQHTFEIMSKGDNKFIKLESKRTQREKDIKALFQIMIDMIKYVSPKSFAGLKYFEVKLNPLDIRKEYQKIETVSSLLENDLISKVQALMIQFNISEVEARRMIQQKINDERFLKDIGGEDAADEVVKEEITSKLPVEKTDEEGED